MLGLLDRAAKLTSPRGAKCQYLALRPRSHVDNVTVGFLEFIRFHLSRRSDSKRHSFAVSPFKSRPRPERWTAIGRRRMQIFFQSDEQAFADQRAVDL
jgi:hypothetical protein